MRMSRAPKGFNNELLLFYGLREDGQWRVGYEQLLGEVILSAMKGTGWFVVTNPELNYPEKLTIWLSSKLREIIWLEQEWI